MSVVAEPVELLLGPLAIEVDDPERPWVTVCGTVYERDGMLATVIPSREREFVLVEEPLPDGKGGLTAETTIGRVWVRPLRASDRMLFASPRPRTLREVRARARQAIDLYGALS